MVKISRTESSSTSLRKEINEAKPLGADIEKTGLWKRRRDGTCRAPICRDGPARLYRPSGGDTGKEAQKKGLGVTVAQCLLPVQPVSGAATCKTLRHLTCLGGSRGPTMPGRNRPAWGPLTHHTARWLSRNNPALGPASPNTGGRHTARARRRLHQTLAHLGASPRCVTVSVGGPQLSNFTLKELRLSLR